MVKELVCIKILHKSPQMSGWHLHISILSIQNKWIIKICKENRLTCLFWYLKQQAYIVQWNIYSLCSPFADLFFWIDYLWKLSWHELLYADKREVKRSILISYQLLVKLTRPGRAESMWSEDSIYHKSDFMAWVIHPHIFTESRRASR